MSTLLRCSPESEFAIFDPLVCFGVLVDEAADEGVKELGIDLDWHFAFRGLYVKGIVNTSFSFLLILSTLSAGRPLSDLAVCS